jgi:hypothetical protein
MKDKIATSLALLAMTGLTSFRFGRNGPIISPIFINAARGTTEN